MKRKNIKWIVAAALLLGFVGLAAYQLTGGLEYSTEINGLKAQFNADKGKVRLLVLLSPT